MPYSDMPWIAPGDPSLWGPRSTYCGVRREPSGARLHSAKTRPCRTSQLVTSLWYRHFGLIDRLHNIGDIRQAET